MAGEMTNKQATSKNHYILADGHVHIHDCFSLDSVLDSALKNFRKAASLSSDEYVENFQGVLFLAEISTQKRFQTLLRDIQRSDKKEVVFGSWKISLTNEIFSLHARNSDDESIFIFAGRQVVTQENLEVLALITIESFNDGQSLDSTIHNIVSSGGLPVLPWGVGKWIGKRGSHIKDILTNPDFPSVLLGDNSGRPIFWLNSPYLKLARTKGLKILPGTDPLPLFSECDRIGSFGFKISSALSLHNPGQEMKKLLLNHTNSISPYGSLENPFRFFNNQLSIRIHEKSN